MTLPDAESVLAFWFGIEEDSATGAKTQAALWWSKNPQMDATIAARFGDLREQALTGALDGWTETPRGRLALIILVDQFSRNVFRDDARAFAHDALARRWCVDGLVAGDDARLSAIERVFFYLPLEHSERLDDQQRSVQLFAVLADAAPSAAHEIFKGFVDFAQRHHDIIARFGRFPHRNAILGRDSTIVEQAFLTQPGSSF